MMDLDAVQSYEETERIGPEQCSIWKNFCWMRLPAGISWSEKREKIQAGRKAARKGDGAV